MKPFIKTLVAIASVVAGLHSGSALAQGKGETIKVQDYPGLGNAMVRVAIEKGICEKNGIKCQLQMIPSSPLGMQAMMAKSIDVAFAPTDAVNLAVQKGTKMKMVVGGNSSNILLLAMGNHIEAPGVGKPFPAFMQDLKGKKIGVAARGSTVEIMASWMLEKAGMNPEKDVTFVATGGVPTSYGALQSKQVDAVFSYDPVGVICDLAKTCKVAWRADADKMPSEMFATNGGVVNQVFMQEYIDKNPHVVEAFIKSVKEADAFINNPANFAEVLAITGKYFKLEMPQGDAILAANLKRYIATGNYRAAIDRKSVQANLDMTLTTKQVEKIMPLSDLIYDKAP